MSIAQHTNQGLNSMLSDEQVEHYAAIFIVLNEQYLLTRYHHFTFEDFLDSPEAFELNIHRYFANQPLLENRRNGISIYLHTFLCYPEALMAASNIDCAEREATAVRCEQLLPKQIAAVQKIDLAEMTWFAERVMLLFEHHHRVLMRGGVYVQPCTHYYRCERKRAGGKR